jgi:hypothetical protein
MTSTTRPALTGSSLAASMLNGRNEAWLTAKQTKFLQDVLVRELQREIAEFNRRNPGPTAHQPRLGWRERSALDVEVNGRAYKLVVASNGAGHLAPVDGGC